MATEMPTSVDGLVVAAQPGRADRLPPLPAPAASTTLRPRRPRCPGSWLPRQPLLEHCWQEPRTGEWLKFDRLAGSGSTSQVTSYPQFFFWLASSLCQALTLTSAILGPHTEGKKTSASLDVVRFPNVCKVGLGNLTTQDISHLRGQGQNGEVCWPPSLSASPSSFSFSHFGPTSHLFMRILQVIAPNHLYASRKIIAPFQGHNPDNPSPKHTASTPSRLWFGWSAFDLFIFPIFLAVPRQLYRFPCH